MAPASSTDSPVLTDIVRRLVAAYQPERIYLFGSMARGTQGRIATTTSWSWLPMTRRQSAGVSRRGYEALVGTGYAADILVWRRSAFDVRLSLAASLPATVAREGRLLYAA